MADETSTDPKCLGYEGHFVTYFILFGGMMLVPFYLLATYVYSGVSNVKPAMILAWIWLVFGAIMSTVTMFDAQSYMGTAGSLIIPFAWFMPSALLAIFRRHFFAEPLSQKWLVGLQLFRSIGGIFLIEMARGNLAPIFAYAAGIGDLVVALCAAIVLCWYRSSDVIPGRAVYFIIIVGMADFFSAFFFGFTSSNEDAQLFFHDALYNPVVFPSGLIPNFLVPYAIFFHTMSYINQVRFRGQTDLQMDVEENDIEKPSIRSA